MSTNILALYVIVENRNALSEYLLLKGRVSLRQSEDLVKGASSSDSVGSPEAGEDTVVAGSLAVVAPVLLPLIFVGAQMVTDSFEIKRNFMKKELRSTTLSLHEKAGGFVYFSFPEETTRSDNFYFSIEITNQRTHDIDTYVIPFTLETEDNS